MNRTRTLFQGITLLVAGAIALLVMLRSPDLARGQEVGVGMVRTGIVGIETDDERKLFWSLICTCGCPRETLGTCTCGFAHDRRDELRAELAKGRTIEEIKASYVKRYGTEALAVPPNTGSQRLIFLFPITAIVLGAGFVIVTLRRWRARSEAADKARRAGGSKPVAGGSRDDYDDKLDEELKSLDRE